MKLCQNAIYYANKKLDLDPTKKIFKKNLGNFSTAAKTSDGSETVPKAFISKDAIVSHLIASHSSPHLFVFFYLEKTRFLLYPFIHSHSMLAQK